MTFSEFESAYYDFDIVFQNVLEDLRILDTFSLDTVEVDFDAQKIKLNWRDAHIVFEVNNVTQKVELLQALLTPARKFQLSVSHGSHQKLNEDQKLKTISWLTNQLRYIFMEG